MTVVQFLCVRRGHLRPGAQSDAYDKPVAAVRTVAKLVLGGVITMLPVSGAHATDDFSEALLATRPTLDMRYRFEWVDDENLKNEASANTLRTRFGLQTGIYRGFGIYVEGENVTHIGDDLFNDSENNRLDYPSVPDPSVTELNQGYLSYGGVPDTLLKVGRQVITYDNRRFIGDMAWRQNQQTYDAVTLVNRSIPDTIINYGYLYNSNTIFGDGNRLKGNSSMNTHLLNIQYRGLPFGSLTGYAYLLDFDKAPVDRFTQTRDFSSQTYGLRWVGSYPLRPDWNVLTTAEYAHQWRYAGNTNALNQNYYFMELGVEHASPGPVLKTTAKVGYEVLGGGNDINKPQLAFQTPLYTVHPFEGWANRFAVDPGNGVRDLYLSVEGEFQWLRLQGVYHHFQSDRGNMYFGDEYDFLATKSISTKLAQIPVTYSLSLKYAWYNGNKGLIGGPGERFANDTQFVWLYGELKF